MEPAKSRYRSKSNKRHKGRGLSKVFTASAFIIMFVALFLVERDRKADMAELRAEVTEEKSLRSQIAELNQWRIQKADLIALEVIAMTDETRRVYKKINNIEEKLKLMDQQIAARDSAALHP